MIRTDGVGDLSFKDFGLVSAKADTSAVTLALDPHGALGGDFAIGTSTRFGAHYAARRPALAAAAAEDARIEALNKITTDTKGEL